MTAIATLSRTVMEANGLGIWYVRATPVCATRWGRAGLRAGDRDLATRRLHRSRTGGSPASSYPNRSARPVRPSRPAGRRPRRFECPYPTEVTGDPAHRDRRRLRRCGMLRGPARCRPAQSGRRHDLPTEFAEWMTVRTRRLARRHDQSPTTPAPTASSTASVGGVRRTEGEDDKGGEREPRLGPQPSVQALRREYHQAGQQRTQDDVPPAAEPTDNQPVLQHHQERGSDDGPEPVPPAAEHTDEDDEQRDAQGEDALHHYVSGRHRAGRAHMPPSTAPSTIAIILYRNVGTPSTSAASSASCTAASPRPSRDPCTASATAHGERCDQEVEQEYQVLEVADPVRSPGRAERRALTTVDLAVDPRDRGQDERHSEREKCEYLPA